MCGSSLALAMFQSPGFAELVAATMHLSCTGVFKGSQYKGSASKLMSDLCVSSFWLDPTFNILQEAGAFQFRKCDSPADCPYP